MTYEYKPARTVRPRTPATNADRKLAIVIDSGFMLEGSSEIGPVDWLVTSLRHMPLTTVVCASESIKFLKLVQDHWGKRLDHSDKCNCSYCCFNFRTSPIEREIFTGKQHGRKLTLSLTSVAWFGWRGEKTGRKNTVRNRYHLLIDPLTFSGNWLEDRSFVTYMKWAQDIRAFCIEQNWNLRPTQGSVARQALTDSRFYPDKRRKVPRATNDRIRQHLPGNHYQLATTVSQRTEYEADYLDQTRCHHFHAIEAKLPDSNFLYGYGHFRHPERKRKWRKTPGRVASFLNGFSGLVYGHLYWPIAERSKNRFVPKYLTAYGTEKQPANEPVYFFTEDLQLLESLGVRINAIIAAWGSKKLDTGLARYAKFALSELERDAPLWKKTLLLSPYGALATTARKQTVAYHRSKKGTPKVLMGKGGTRLSVSYHEASKVSEPSTNNVLHRALIEASNRTETLMFANQLELDGYRVLCIYVDAVIIETQGDRQYSDSWQIPELWKPWRHDRHLTHLRFISDSQFVSAELEKLPGLTGQQRRNITFGSLKQDTTLGTRNQRQIRAWQAWQEDRLPAAYLALQKKG